MAKTGLKTISVTPMLYVGSSSSDEGGFTDSTTSRLLNSRSWRRNKARSPLADVSIMVHLTPFIYPITCFALFMHMTGFIFIQMPTLKFLIAS